jgi:thiamine-phosphate diphosphorylase/hydroxyethylthiazole kinase
VLIREASALHEVTQKYGVPLIINDRVDVALAVGADGVHVGQDDMDVQTVRSLLQTTTSNPIVGVSASTIDEALTASRNGATYLGLGSVFATPTFVFYLHFHSVRC